jgi:hypothetical protein
MSIHISTGQIKIKKKIKAHCLGKSIFLPHVRYIVDGKRSSIMYHSHIIISNGHFYTLGCKRMDISGLCSGHKMNRKEFLKRYCDGIEPKMKSSKES